MQQVSVGIIKVLAIGVSELKNVPTAQLFDEPRFSNFAKQKDSDWCTWNHMSDWMNWLDSGPLAPIDWKAVGIISIRTNNTPLAADICRMALSLRFAYWLAAKWFGTSQFRVINCQFEDIAKNHVRETLTIPANLNPCPQVFRIFEGTLVQFPQAYFNMNPSVVTCTTDGKSAVYDIKLPSKEFRMSNYLRIIKSFLKLKSLFIELGHQQTAINEQTNQLLRERSEFQTMIDGLPDGIIIHRDEIIIYINQKMATFLDYDRQSLMGKNCFDLILASQHERIRNRIQHVKGNPGVMNTPLEVTFVKKDQITQFDGETTSMEITYDGIPAVAVVIRDLTERKSFEYQLIANDRLTSLGLLAAGIGHEVNNPLCYVMLKLEKLKVAVESRAEVDEIKMISEMQEGLFRIQTIIKDLKKMSRSTIEEAATPVDIANTLRSAIAMANNEIQHRAQLSLEIGDLPPVMASDGQLCQVFVNLLINAAQAIEPGQVSKNKINIKAFVDDNFVVVEISDTGSGIPKKIQSNLYQPFFTTKPIGQGTGLGLSICQSILSRYEGKISFISEINEGTTFKVTFPISTEELKKSLAATKKKPRSPIKKGRILMIDDDLVLLETVAEAISKNFDPVPVSRAESALDLIRKGEHFDAILCDLMMPDVGGIEFYARLKVEAPILCDRTIFLTGGSFTAATDYFLSQPEIKFCEKPISSNELCDLLSNIIKSNSELAQDLT